MPETSDINVSTKFGLDPNPSASGIYFGAVSITSSPVVPGSDTEFTVASLALSRGGLRGGGTQPDQDTSATVPFSITVNGTTDTDNAQTSPFTIDCVGGTGTYPARGTGTIPQDVNFPDPTGLSVSGPSGSDTDYYRVYAKVGATMTDNGMDVDTAGTIEIKEASTAADPLGSNTRYRNNGLDDYDFFFLIGTVAIQKRKDGLYKVSINQIQEGNYSYGNVQSTTAIAGGQTVSTKDGPRRFTICINGEPFTCHIDVSEIVKVT